MMDFSDQQVYSKATSDIKGNECITDKGALAHLNLSFTPKTYHIKECKWVGEEPPKYPPGATEKNPGVWFVKGTLRNYSTGIFMARTKEECIKISEKENSYVVQAQIVCVLFSSHETSVFVTRNHTIQNKNETYRYLYSSTIARVTSEHTILCTAQSTAQMFVFSCTETDILPWL